MVSGGERPTASQNNLMSVSATGGNGQSGKFVAEKAAKASQLRPSGGGKPGATAALTDAIRQGGNVATTASAANPAKNVSMPSLFSMLGDVQTLDSEPSEFRPIADGVDLEGSAGRGSEALPAMFRQPQEQVQNTEMIRRYLPDLINATRIPGVPDSYRRFVNYLKEII
jgi:hypothetical protein